MWFVIVCWRYIIERDIDKEIIIEYPYNFGLPLGISAFVTIWLEFDLLVRTIVQSKWYKNRNINTSIGISKVFLNTLGISDNADINSTSTVV